MDKQSIAMRVLALPEEIEAAEKELINAEMSLRAAKANLQHKEDGLLLGVFDGIVIDGKNAETRNAQIRSHTESEREAVMNCEMELTRVRYRVERLHNEFRALQAVAGMLREVA
ncbi:hypothetical protein [Paenibacillus residui]|uniref:Uncharacterized protein n=1 Tax=Paenibacillus residui TaxID=629724 RepID=A0ABW3D8M9_9BACL